MPKRSSKDVNVIASQMTEKIIKETEKDAGKNPNAVALGRLGGLKGGKARIESMTPEQRKELAQKAARKRWSVRPKP